MHSALTHPLSAAMVLVLSGALQACSSPQMYGAGQAWQQQECSKINDAEERRRCTARANVSYGDYKRQVDAAQGSK